MTDWWKEPYRGGPMVPVPGCIIGGHLQGNGYARVTTNDGRRLAHRVAWENVHGPIPEGFQLHHRCGTKACVNVSHLELLTMEDHARLHAKGPQCDHPRRRLPNGRSYCPTCEAEWDRNRAERRRAQRRLKYQIDPVYRARRLEENRCRRATKTNG